MNPHASIPLSPRMRVELIASSLAINTLMLAMPITTLQIYDRVLPHPGSGTLTMLAVGVVGAVVLETILRLARSRVTSAAAQAYERQRSTQLVAHALASWVYDAQRHHHGEFVQALSAIGRMKDYALQRLITLSVDLPYVLLFMGLLLAIGGILVVVPLVAVSAFGALVVLWGRRLRTAIVERNAADEARYGFMLETLAGIHVIKAMGLEPRFIHRYRAVQLRGGASNLAIARLNHLLASGTAVFSQLLVVLVVAAGAPLVMHQVISMGALIACVLLSGRLIQPLQHALMCWMGYQEFEQAHAQVARITDLPLQPLQVSASVPREGSIQCSNLAFTYAREESPVFEQLNLTVQPGEALAITGESSAGRTTLLKLVAGMIAPSEGEVRVDWVDPTQWLPRQLAQQMAYLGPEPILLRGTIMDNVTCFDAGMTDRALEIARLIGLDGLVSQLPLGFDTPLEGAQAEIIPPGFRQRVAIARALLHKPKIVLYDQADRSLDREGYHQLFRLLARLKGKATLVLVADDQNLIRLCDRVLILRGGRLIPAATHQSPVQHLQLVERRGA